MKKLLLLFTLVFAGIAVNAQVIAEKDVPQAVLTQYNKDFPNIKAKRWELNKNIKQYVVVLNNSDGVATRARYKDDGTKIWFIMNYTPNQLPPNVAAATLAAYPGFKLDWAMQVTNFTNNTVAYDLRLSKAGYVLHAYVNADGTVITDASKLPAQFKLGDEQPK